jgi:hypothetical protein
MYLLELVAFHVFPLYRHQGMQRRKRLVSVPIEPQRTPAHNSHARNQYLEICSEFVVEVEEAEALSAVQWSYDTILASSEWAMRCCSLGSSGLASIDSHDNMPRDSIWLGTVRNPHWYSLSCERLNNAEVRSGSEHNASFSDKSKHVKLSRAPIDEGIVLRSLLERSNSSKFCQQSNSESGNVARRLPHALNAVSENIWPSSIGKLVIWLQEMFKFRSDAALLIPRGISVCNDNEGDDDDDDNNNPNNNDNDSQYDNNDYDRNQYL